MKITKIILSALFLLFAYFQLNDPDPWMWVILYIFVAAVMGFAAFDKYNRYVILAGIGITALGCLATIKSVWEFLTNDDGMGLAEGMSYEHPYIEESREFGGMLIALLALLFIWRQYKQWSS